MIARPSWRHRRGWVMLDVVSGLMLMLVTLTLLAHATMKSRTAARRLANDRAASRLAETALLRLAADTAGAPAEGVVVQNLEAAAPAGHRWGSVTATVEGRSATLIGLIRAANPATAPATAEAAR